MCRASLLKRMPSTAQAILVMVVLGCFLEISPAIPLSRKENDAPNQLTKNTFRIVNGVPVTDKDEYPFVVDLSAHPVAVSSSRFCTGTLIRKDVVLTAAHCVLNDGYTSPVYATVGRIELDDMHEENKEAETFGTVASIVHPEYRGLGSGKDVALLLLNGSSSSPTVKLASASPQENEEAWVVGYGVQRLGTAEATGQPIEVLSGRLQKTALWIRNKTFCDIPQAELRTAEGMLCTAGVKEGSSACKGDSGGGLFLQKGMKADMKGVKRNQGRLRVQVGVVSYGDSMCMSEDSGVFTDVSSVKDWIDKSAQRLEQVFHAARIELSDVKEEAVIHKFSPVSELPGSKLLLPGSVKNEIAHGKNVRFYKVQTNFTEPRVVTVSLCGGKPDLSAALHVTDNINGAVFTDRGSCPGGRLSKVSFTAKQGNYVLGVLAEEKGSLRMDLSAERA